MSFKVNSLIAALAVALAAPVAMAQTKAEKAEKPEKAEKASKSVPSGLSVNGVQISKAFVDAMNKDREARGQPASPDMDKAIKDELVTREVLAQAAKKKGMDKNPTIAAQMEMAKQAVLISSYIEEASKANPVSDAQIKAMYDQGVAQMGDKEYKVRHIQVDTEDEAKTVIANLKRGDSFEKIAKEKSKDTGSKDNGGDLDWGPAGRFPPDVANAIKGLQKGQFTETPVKSQAGFHVLRVDDTRALKVPSLDEAKDSLRQRAQQEMIRQMVMSLREKAKIEGL